MISLKSEREIALMQKAGEIVGSVFEKLEGQVMPGITTGELDRIAAGLIISLGGKSAFLGYRGYPGNICTSINEVVVHGIPGDTRLKEGDIISIDIGAEYMGYCADAAATFAVGEVSKEARRLMDVTESSLNKGIEKAKAGKRLSDISCAVQELVERNGFSVVRAFVGHGIGSRIHEEPEVPNFGRPNSGVRLEAGMALAIEPMVNQGVYDIMVLEDGWTAVTKDGKLSAHFEHTIVITEGEPKVLTRWQKKNR